MLYRRIYLPHRCQLLRCFDFGSRIMLRGFHVSSPAKPDSGLLVRRVRSTCSLEYGLAPPHFEAMKNHLTLKALLLLGVSVSALLGEGAEIGRPMIEDFAPPPRGTLQTASIMPPWAPDGGQPEYPATRVS